MRRRRRCRRWEGDSDKRGLYARNTERGGRQPLRHRHRHMRWAGTGKHIAGDRITHDMIHIERAS